MSYSNRIFIYGPVGLLLLIVTLYSVFWRVQADTLAARLDRANGGEIAPGVEFQFAEKSVGGFPFRLDVVLSGVTVSHKAPEGETAWRSEKVALHALSYNSSRYILEADGLQSFARPGERGAPPRVLYVTPGIARASAILQQGKLARFDLDLWQSAGKDATLNADPARTFSAARAQLHLLRRADDTVDVAIKIEDAELGKGYAPVLGGKIALADLRGKITQAGALDAVAAGDEAVAEAADSWRTKNGMLEVNSLTLDWSGVKTEMKGVIGLDAQQQLSGALIGAFDPGAALKAVTKGKFTLQLAGPAQFSLQFKNGEVLTGFGSGFPPSP